MSLFERLPIGLLVRNNTGNADTVTTSHLGYGSGTVNGGKDTLNITFSDFTQTVLSDASLPTRFNLGDWNSSYSYLSLNSFVYTYGAPGSSFSERDGANFQFDSLTPVTPVPLPAGIWLLSAGLAGLGMVRRRKRGQPDPVTEPRGPFGGGHEDCERWANDQLSVDLQFMQMLTRQMAKTRKVLRGSGKSDVASSKAPAKQGDRRPGGAGPRDTAISRPLPNCPAAA